MSPINLAGRCSPCEGGEIAMRDADATTTQHNLRPAARSGTFAIGGDLPVHRLGFRALRTTGQGYWGEPRDHEEAIAVRRRAVGPGLTLTHYAGSYGPQE